MHEHQRAELLGLCPERVDFGRRQRSRHSRARQSPPRAGPDASRRPRAAAAARSGNCSELDASATKRSGWLAHHFASPSFCALTMAPARVQSVTPYHQNPLMLSAWMSMPCLSMSSMRSGPSARPPPGPAFSSNGVPLTTAATSGTVQWACTSTTRTRRPPMETWRRWRRRLSHRTRGGHHAALGDDHSRRRARDGPEEIPAIGHDVSPLRADPQQLHQVAAEDGLFFGVAQELAFNTRSTVTGQLNGTWVP